MLVLLLLAYPCTLAISTPIPILDCVATRGVTVQNNELSIAKFSSMSILGVVEFDKPRSRQRAVITSVQFIVSENSSLVSTLSLIALGQELVLIGVAL